MSTHTTSAAKVEVRPAMQPTPVIENADLRLKHEGGFRFRVDFDDPAYPPLWLDEPLPLGQNRGPNAVRLLGAAIGDCLASTLVLSLRRAGWEPKDLEGHVRIELTRNEQHQLRINHVTVTLKPGIQAKYADAVKRAIHAFEAFSTVTESLRHGIPIDVEVETT